MIYKTVSEVNIQALPFAWAPDLLFIKMSFVIFSGSIPLQLYRKLRAPYRFLSQHFEFRMYVFLFIEIGKTNSRNRKTNNVLFFPLFSFFVQVSCSYLQRSLW
jgi:hypothetical protein